MVFEIEISFHYKKGQNFHFATCVTLSILRKRQKKRGRVERKGEKVAVLPCC